MSDQEKLFNFYLIYTSRFTVAIMLVPIIIAIWKRQYLNKPLKIFLWYCVITFFLNFVEQLIVWLSINYLDLIMPLLKKYNISDTNFLLSFHQFKNYIFLGWFFITLLNEQISTQWLKYCTVTLFLFTVYNIFFTEGFRLFGVINPILSVSYCFLLSSYYLWFAYNSDMLVLIQKNPFLWFSFSISIRYLLSLLFFSFGNKMHTTDFILFVKVALFRNSIEAISYIMIAIGFYHAKYGKYLFKKDKTRYKFILPK